MDTAGLILASFKAAVDTFRFIQVMRASDEVSRDIDAIFILQVTKFQAWGDAWGLEDPVQWEKAVSQTPPATKETVLLLLRRIEATLNPRSKIQTKRQFLPGKILELMSSSSSKSERAKRGIKAGVSAFKWALEDEINFVAVTERLEKLVNGLNELLPRDQLQYANRMATIQTVATDDTKRLDFIQTHTSPASEEALLAKLRTLKLSEYNPQPSPYKQIYDDYNNQEEILRREIEVNRETLTFAPQILKGYDGSQQMDMQINLNPRPLPRSFFEAIKVSEEGTGLATVEKASLKRLSCNRVMVEWKHYTDRKTAYDKLVLEQRIQKPVKVLYKGASFRPADLKTFDCVGYFDEEGNKRFGIVFDLDPRLYKYYDQPKTLENLLSTGSYSLDKGATFGPSLDARLDMSRQLIRMLISMRATQWMHRSVRSENIFVLTSSIDGEKRFDLRLAGFQFTMEENNQNTQISPSQQDVVITQRLNGNIPDQQPWSFIDTYGHDRSHNPFRSPDLAQTGLVRSTYQLLQHYQYPHPPWAPHSSVSMFAHDQKIPEPQGLPESPQHIPPPPPLPHYTSPLPRYTHHQSRYPQHQVGFTASPAYASGSSPSSNSNSNLRSRTNRISYDPEYLSDKEMVYKPLYDFYGLGMIMLEIATWNSIISIWHHSFDQHSGDMTVFKQIILSQFCPSLGFLVGGTYQKIVTACLEKNFRIPAGPSPKKNTETDDIGGLDSPELIDTPSTEAGDFDDAKVTKVEKAAASIRNNLDKELIAMWSVLGKLEFCSV